MSSHLWDVVQTWIDEQRFPPSQAAIARHLGVQRSTVSQWKKGQSRPTPAHLRALHEMTGLPYEVLLSAMLRDAGYLGELEGVQVR